VPLDPAPPGTGRAPGSPAGTPDPAGGSSAGIAGLLISTLVIPARPEHVRAARAFTDLVLGVQGSDDDGTASLLVSELVTNSLLHSDSRGPGGTIAVTVAIAPGEVLVEVTDDGGGEPAPRDAGDSGENGRGLHLVTALSQAWGYIAASGRLTTWFELKTEGSTRGE
jgi:anti-sigma regulatory factor (Ser/Thr protein kinase)